VAHKKLVRHRNKISSIRLFLLVLLPSGALVTHPIKKMEALSIESIQGKTNPKVLAFLLREILKVMEFLTNPKVPAIQVRARGLKHV
jgi:hypothetical protein